MTVQPFQMGIKDPNCSSIFEDLSTLRLSKYYILHYHDKFTIFDLFAKVIRFIWKAHWQQFVKQTPVLDEIALNNKYFPIKTCFFLLLFYQNMIVLYVCKLNP